VKKWQSFIDSSFYDGNIFIGTDGYDINIKCNPLGAVHFQVDPRLFLMNRRKILQKILDGSKNIKFSDMGKLVESFGFKLSRTDGSHHIFSRADIPELVNIQSVKGQVKPYQIRQFLKLVEKYDLSLEGSE